MSNAPRSIQMLDIASGLLLLGALVIFVSLPVSAAPQAATLYVSPSGSDTDCLTPETACAHIQEAINLAGTTPTTIVVAASTYNELVTIQSVTNTQITIQGAGVGSTIIDGGGSGPVLTVQNGTTGVVSGVTIQNGSNSTPGGGAEVFFGGILTLSNSSVISNSAQLGGGIDNGGTLSVQNSTISGNAATGICGGGLNNSGTLTVAASTINGNSATGSPGNGGGLCNGYGNVAATATLVNSTISGNTVTFSGGGIFNDTAATLSLSYVTIAFNQANTGSGSGTGGGITNSGAASNLSLKSSLIAGNTNGTTAEDCSGNVSSGGYNLIQATTSNCSFSGASSDVTGQNPHLGPLQNNGGPTQTQALMSGSPAINKIPSGTNGCGTTVTADQRGSHRPVGGACEIGAFEVSWTLFLPLILR